MTTPGFDYATTSTLDITSHCRLRIEMGADITIRDAQHSDLPEMIALCCEAVEEDILTRFLYDHRHSEAVRKQTESLTKSLGARYNNPTNRCYIVKATDTKTEEIVGWSLVRWEAGFTAATRSDTIQQDFQMHYNSKVKQNWVERVGLKPHVVLGALYVKVGQQRNGIGRSLVEYFYSKYDLHKEFVIVQTRAVSEGFYQRLGWVTVDSTDIDLSEWGGKGRGFGIHRSPQMIRYPEC